MSRRPKQPANKPSSRSVSLTELDWSILNQMSLDPLASNRAMAEAIGVPANQVAARIRWLDQKNVTRVIATLDLQATGQSFCLIQISICGRPIGEVAADIIPIRQTLSVSACNGGMHDLLVLLRFSNAQELNELLFRTLAKIRGINAISVSTVLDIPIFRSKYVTYMPHFIPVNVEANIQELELDYDESVIDNVDRCIIAELQQDGRKSINDIARRHDINSSTIRYRVKNLESKGLLRFITVFDPSVIGINSLALFEIVVSANHIDKVVKQLKKNSNFDQLFLCAGPSTLMSIVQADAVETIQRIKSEEIATIEGVLDVKVTPIIHTYKLDLRWGQRYSE